MRKKKMNNRTNLSAGLSVCDIILVIFIVFKLFGVIKWSWVVVLIPLWIELAVFAILLFVMVHIIFKTK